jgi:quinol monooxygenase YgiN
MPTALVLRRLPLDVVGCITCVEPWRRPPEGTRFVTRVENQAVVPSTPWKAASGAAPTKETIMGELQGIVRFTFHAGKVEEFKRLSAECLEIVRAKDVGTLQYDTYFNDDESECIVLERFRDSDALILHGQNMAPLMESIMATGTISGELLGDLSEGLRAQMADSPVGLFTLYQAL